MPIRKTGNSVLKKTGGLGIVESNENVWDYFYTKTFLN
jgi:hypothetical protein